MFVEFDFDDMRLRLHKIMKHNPQTLTYWARAIGLGDIQFRVFLKGKQRGLHPKSAFKLEKFIEQKEKEYVFE